MGWPSTQRHHLDSLIDVLVGVNVPNFGPETTPARPRDQILGDLDVLRLLGAEAVVLDPFLGDPAETERPEVAWETLATVKGRWSNK